MILTLTTAGVHRSENGVVTVIPYAEASRTLIEQALAATPAHARQSAPARMARAVLHGRLDQAAEIAEATAGEHVATAAYAATPLNRTAVAYERARDRLIAAQDAVRRRASGLAATGPGGAKLAADPKAARAIAARDDDPWRFRTLHAYVAALDELDAATAALPAIEDAFREAQALAEPEDIATIEAGVRPVSDGDGNAALREAVNTSGISTREIAARLRIGPATLRRMLRGGTPLAADDPIIERVRQAVQQGP